MKIKKISVQNFKALSELEMNFDGCSAIITAGNNKGKSSILNGLIKRFQGEKPNLIVKQGESKGFNHMELTDGTIIEWNFTEKSENFAVQVKDQLKVKTGVLSAIGEKYFGKHFDIDKFLNSTPAAQTKELQKLIGIDLTEIDSKIKEAYDNRTFANRTFKDVAAKKLDKPVPENHREPDTIKAEISQIETENKTALENWQTENNSKRAEVEKENAKLRENWKTENEKHLKEVQEFNATQRMLTERKTTLMNKQLKLDELLKDSNLERFYDFEAADKYIDNLQEGKTEKQLTNIPEPEYLTFTESEKPEQKRTDNLYTELENSQRYFTEYRLKLEQYENWVKEGKEARTAKENAEKEYNKLYAKKQNIIKSANMPKGFEFSENGILYDGFVLSDNQISTSKKYIAALKLGAMALGELKTLHFDASFLDKNSLLDVQKWAESQDLQLLIERPDYDAGDIKYDIINKL